MPTQGWLLRVALAAALELELGAAKLVDWSQRMIACYHETNHQQYGLLYQECVQCKGFNYV